MLDLSLNSSAEWEISQAIGPAQDGHALYKLVLAAADTSKGELQAKVYANFWKLKPAQAVPSPLELKNFACKLWANWLELDGSTASPEGAKRVIKRLMEVMPRGSHELEQFIGNMDFKLMGEEGVPTFTSFEQFLRFFIEAYRMMLRHSGVTPSTDVAASMVLEPSLAETVAVLAKTVSSAIVDGRATLPSARGNGGRGRGSGAGHGMDAAMAVTVAVAKAHRAHRCRPTRAATATSVAALAQNRARSAAAWCATSRWTCLTR
jgi:hypothetical protein